MKIDTKSANYSTFILIKNVVHHDFLRSSLIGKMIFWKREGALT